ncbi:hypothetical protein PR003_g27189 [Phytophthora rubi]|uniref:Uncharacterized protein n=1 Tax=Phytophthora rubi TaxID=129364 RepID=A0A6A4C1Q8_9STRA|nr:hypothetical protein PR002_g31358 [Phytophthora rubi]KAE8974754.1 hypothetical protein PR001_g25903 [Phytophthora rubi]KAE9283208.1 hypothetical protein PR003_g27189 [Phytophthora rubi]
MWAACVRLHCRRSLAGLVASILDQCVTQRIPSSSIRTSWRDSMATRPVLITR